MAILSGGRCVAAGAVTDVIGRADAGLIVRVDDLARAAAALAEAGIAAEADDGHLRVAVPPDQSALVTRTLAARDLWVTELRPDHTTLEDRFLELTEQEIACMTLLLTEMRRALHRRLVWVLIGLALGLSIVGAIIVFVDSAGGLSPAQSAGYELHPASMTSWWVPGGGDGWIAVCAFFLAIGGMIGGASVAGAEWRAGTVATVLTWEPRRTRLLAARMGAAGILAAAIATVLQLCSLVLLLPAVVVNGTTAGTDGAWWLGLAGAVGRASALTALAAVLALAIANIGRNTTAALAAITGWLLVGEGLVRGLKPGWARHLLSDNLAVVLTWAPLDGDVASHSPGHALATLLVYTAIPVAAAVALFRRRDLVG